MTIIKAAAAQSQWQYAVLVWRAVIGRVTLGPRFACARPFSDLDFRCAGGRRLFRSFHH